ncbi:MAG: hypothetical protein AB7U35_13790, partial [Sphingobium sp.]
MPRPTSNIQNMVTPARRERIDGKVCWPVIRPAHRMADNPSAYPRRMPELASDRMPDIHARPYTYFSFASAARTSARRPVSQTGR